MSRSITRIAAVLALLASTTAADSWPPPEPMAAVSANTEWLVRVTPGQSIGDVYGFAGQPTGKYARATIFWFSPKRQQYVQRGQFLLGNPVSPVELFVSDRGHVVTVDNWHNLGIGTVVAIYTRTGEVVREHSLSDLFDSEGQARLKRTSSSVHWRCRASMLDETDQAVFIWDSLGRMLKIEYQDGSVETRSEVGECRLE